LSTYCSGYDQYGSYANGSGGTYSQLIQSNSGACGWPPNEVVTGPTHVPPLSSTTITVTNGAPNTTVTETSGSIVAPNNRITLDGSGSGTFSALIGAPIYYYFTFSFAGTGHTRSLTVVGDYTYDVGLLQEYNLTSDQLILTKAIGDQLYGSNNSFTYYQGALGTPVIRWGLYRRPDASGVAFWAKGYSGTTITQEIINAFFYSCEIQPDTGINSDHARALTSNKTFLANNPTGTPGYGDFYDRPVP
jgi:hypothetical protein